LSVKPPGFCTEKKPSPLIAMKVATWAACTSPCTLLVERDIAVTEPASCRLTPDSGIRSRKLVSMRLKAVVCEFAMLPEMFSSANDCARMPATDVVNAPKIPITIVSKLLRRPPDVSNAQSRNRKEEEQAMCQQY
jgi:hypothetical protein